MGQHQRETNITCSNPLEQYQSFSGSLVVYQWCPTSLDYSVRGNQQEQSCSMGMLRLGKKNTTQKQMKTSSWFYCNKQFPFELKKKYENFTESNLINTCMRLRNPTQNIRVSSPVKEITRNLSICFHSKIIIMGHRKHSRNYVANQCLKSLKKDEASTELWKLLRINKNNGFACNYL